MRKELIAALSALLLPISAFAKPNGTYPVSCRVLWSAVTDTLQDAKSYGILEMDDDEHTAQFNITGATPERVGSVALTEKGQECEMTVKPRENGFSDEDEATFHKHVGQSLEKLQSSSHRGF